jgi:prepilin-type N-terminal cleavage/methylation domain-containing protein
MKLRSQCEAGFSLVEMLVVVAILTTVVAVIVGYINTFQTRYNVESMRLDSTQSTREFLDQVARDLHQTGFPGQNMYVAGTLGGGNPWYWDQRAATGIVSASPTQIMFEGDVDGTGTVSSLTYQLATNPATNQCPCVIRRGQTRKLPGDPLVTNVPLFYTEVNGVINSGGAIALSGAGKYGADDAFYAAYKAEPVFRYYDAAGNQVAVPADTGGTGGGIATLQTIRTIRVTLNVLSPYPDQVTGVKPVINMSSTAFIWAQ